jgi:hypothetical protein
VHGMPSLWVAVRTDMATHMKTTVEIAEELLRQAKEVAHRESTTLRSLLEEGLRWVLGQRRQRRKPYRMPDASVSGKGLQPGIDEGNWSSIRDRIYEGRGS